MTNKNFRIYQDIKSKKYYISPNKDFLSILLHYFKSNCSRKYIQNNISEIGYFNEELLPIFYDNNKLHCFINDFMEEFKYTANQLNRELFNRR